MFLPLACGGLLCGALEAALGASKLSSAITAESATQGLRALILAACLRTVLGVFALFVFGANVRKRTHPRREGGTGGFGLSNGKSTTYGQPPWTLILVCLALLGATSVLAVFVEIVLIRSHRRQQAQLAQHEDPPKLSEVSEGQQLGGP